LVSIEQNLQPTCHSRLIWQLFPVRSSRIVSLNVLIAPDKFKGTLTAEAAAKAIARGWHKVRPEDELALLPISDGGDGFGEVIGNLLGAKIQLVKTVNAAHRRCAARWWWDSKTKTAVIESANVVGLAMLPTGKFHPFNLDTLGLGEVLRAAAAKSAKRTIIGIGGSATNDGGFGVARALGWKFLNRDGEEIEHWTDLHTLAHISAPKRTRGFGELIVAVDVQNPLLGPRGATRIYGPQKGLRANDFSVAEKNLRRLAQVAKRKLGENFARVPGTGAAGGLGFGLLAFFGAELEPGFDLLSRFSKLDQRLRWADLVVTGEGRLDQSTLMGKGVGRLAKQCQEMKIPCIAVAGEIAGRSKTRRCFTDAHALTDLTGLERAKSEPGLWLETLARRIAERKLEVLFCAAKVSDA
jgi:glycerate kinase